MPEWFRIWLSDRSPEEALELWDWLHMDGEAGLKIGIVLLPRLVRQRQPGCVICNSSPKANPDAN